MVLDWLNLDHLLEGELTRIAEAYDQSRPWTENDENERRTTPREFKKPSPPATVPIGVDLLSSQIAHREKQTIHPPAHQYSTPATVQPPNLNSKLSPVEKIKPVTRMNTQVLVPIQEEVKEEVKYEAEEELEVEKPQSQAKRRKLEEPIVVPTPATTLPEIGDTNEFDF